MPDTERVPGGGPGTRKEETHIERLKLNGEHNRPDDDSADIQHALEVLWLAAESRGLCFDQFIDELVYDGIDGVILGPAIADDLLDISDAYLAYHRGPRHVYVYERDEP